MRARTPPDDQPVEIVGYVTDPKLIGYQILTNYESTFWRALVGNDAWSLYEILRSFCHDGNNTCRPSIKLLTAILGLQDKRAIIGRNKTVKGKEYQYPGLIDLLQEHGLVVAETRGEGHSISYLYHVNLTPTLLSPEQIEQLPELLQRKHAELLARCEAAIAELETRKRASRFPKIDVRDTEQQVEERDGNFPPLSDQPVEGDGNFPSGDGKRPTADGNFPSEQHPSNTTHTTTSFVEQETPTTPLHNVQQDVVVALTKNGISKRVATQLSTRYQADQIREKIAFLHFLQETNPEKVKNPQGWLRRAVEEDYAPPEGYHSKQEQDEERHAETEPDRLPQEAHRLALTWQERVIQQQNIPDTLRILTEQLQADLALQMTTATFSTWVASIVIAAHNAQQATIAVPSHAAYQWLTHRLKAMFERSLSSLVGEPVEVAFEVVDLVGAAAASTQGAQPELT